MAKRNGKSRKAGRSGSNKSDIPANGRESRIMAQNLLVGDEFLMRNVPNATVLSYSRGKKVTSFNLKIPGKKNLISKTLDNTKRVWIKETQESRQTRRELSRMTPGERYNPDNRTLD